MHLLLALAKGIDWPYSFRLAATLCRALFPGSSQRNTDKLLSPKLFGYARDSSLALVEGSISLVERPKMWSRAEDLPLALVEGTLLDCGMSTNSVVPGIHLWL